MGGISKVAAFELLIFIVILSITAKIFGRRIKEKDVLEFEDGLDIILRISEIKNEKVNMKKAVVSCRMINSYRLYFRTKLEFPTRDDIIFELTFDDYEDISLQGTIKTKKVIDEEKGEIEYMVEFSTKNKDIVFDKIKSGHKNEKYFLEKTP